MTLHSCAGVLRALFVHRLYIVILACNLCTGRACRRRLVILHSCMGDSLRCNTSIKHMLCSCASKCMTSSGCNGNAEQITVIKIMTATRQICRPSVLLCALDCLPLKGNCSENFNFVKALLTYNLTEKTANIVPEICTNTPQVTSKN